MRTMTLGEKKVEVDYKFLQGLLHYTWAPGQPRPFKELPIAIQENSKKYAKLMIEVRRLLEKTQEDVPIDDDPHIGCYSWPNCDEAPNGCCIEMGDDVEEYGYKD